ncbi:hypothetical protein GbCGDNIH4_7192 [Granulibacter bethesdensis CGDNIH4]|nr:hypothetical protein GbCGDNIH4_7192 [Granulibacter bethesdensis CGDNIH4]
MACALIDGQAASSDRAILHIHIRAVSSASGLLRPSSSCLCCTMVSSFSLNDLGRGEALWQQPSDQNSLDMGRASYSPGTAYGA